MSVIPLVTSPDSKLRTERQALRAWTVSLLLISGFPRPNRKSGTLTGLLLFNSCLSALNPPFIFVPLLLGLKTTFLIRQLEFFIRSIKRGRCEAWRSEKGLAPSSSWHPVPYKHLPSKAIPPNTPFSSPTTFPTLEPNLASAFSSFQNQPRCVISQVPAETRGAPEQRGCLLVLSCFSILHRLPT